MPGMSKFLIVRPMIENEKISAEDQREYWLDIDMLFILVKHLRSDIANMTRELSKAKNGANLVAFKAMLCIIKYILDTKNFQFKLRTNRECQQTLGNSLFW